jgi:hypothetical protein
MSDRSRELVTPELLKTRIGKGTVATGLENQIRFRVEGDGPMSQRRFVPDTKLAKDLLDSPAGPKLMRMLSVDASGTGDLWKKSNLKGFILPRDNTATAAAQILGGLDSGDWHAQRIRGAAKNNPKKAVEQASQLYQEVREESTFAGGWNSDGWITFMPDTTRQMLTAAGAYKPRRSEPDLRDALSSASYITGNGVHEVQHSVSPATDYSNERTRWFEEGTANVFSRTPWVHQRNAKSMGVSVESYEDAMNSKPSFDTHWGPWKREPITGKHAKKLEQQSKRNYGDSQVILRQLLELSGVPATDPKTYNEAFHLMQGQSKRFTAGRLADGIIKQHNLDPKVREKLRQRIIDSVESPTSVDDIRTDFGIGPSW